MAQWKNFFGNLLSLWIKEIGAQCIFKEFLVEFSPSICELTVRTTCPSEEPGTDVVQLLVQAQAWVVSGVSLTDTPRYPLPLLFLRLLFSQIRASFLLLYWSISCCQHGPGSSCSAFPGDVPCVLSPLLKLRVHSALETAQLTVSHHPSVHLTSSICLQQKCMSSCSCPS